MSKTALKKELESLTREQIIDVVLTAYSSKKSIKDYFDFFAMPDVDKLYEKFLRELTKEIGRGKYRHSTARISRIRKSIKDFESFNPGIDRVRDLRIATINMLIEQERIKNFSDTLINGTLKLLNDTIAYADRNLIFDSTMREIEKCVAERNDRSRHFRAFLKRNMELPE
ncbi:MAG: hypothetical protein K2J12_00440 [Muribaculaceae bacterium]|nr:hypothetical protein [Muribaculaceae bacterium]